MGLRIVEFFGFDPSDQTALAVQARATRSCPFVGGMCTKPLGEENDGTKIVSGVCTVRQIENTSPVICCPKRLYANEYQILREIAEVVFPGGFPFVHFGHKHPRSRRVIAMGKDFGGEVRLPGVGGKGSFFVDWILALVNEDNSLDEFVAVEVQSIDTTGNYRAERLSGLGNTPFTQNSEAGINWENVNKRILPQLIFKGHVLRLEPRCRAGLFFVCPSPVLARIEQRVGSALRRYPNLHQGSVTFRSYDPEVGAPAGRVRTLIFSQQYTTTVDQLAVAFTAPLNLPPDGAYAKAITRKLEMLS